MGTAGRAVLLDLDGTLVDSKPGILSSYHAMLRALGHEPDPAHDLTHVIGPVMADVMPGVLAHYGDGRSPGRVEQAIAVWREHYGREGLFDSTPYPGIPAALDALHAAGCRLFVATAKRTVYARRLLEHLGLAARFAAIHGSEPGGAVDEKPALIAALLQQEAIPPGGAAMAGDRRFDIAGAHANGLRAVGVLWGYGTRQELEAAGADALAATPAELAGAMLAQL